MAEPTGIMINLGCGKTPEDGFVNHDRVKHSPHVDVAWVLDEMPWPGADGCATRIVAKSVLEPLKVYLVGNEWNTFPKYTKGIETAGLMHYPGDARRWTGMIQGRIDSPVAWAAVKKFEGTHK